MKYFLLKKIALLIVSAFAITLTAFFLLRFSPGDPIQRIVGNSGVDHRKSLKPGDEIYDKLYKDFGFNLPVFYFSISNLAVPDSFCYFSDKNFKRTLIDLSKRTGQPFLCYKLKKEIIALKKEHSQKEYSELHNTDLEFTSIIDKLNSLADIKEIRKLSNPENLNGNYIPQEYKNSFTEIYSIASRISNNSNSWKQFVPIVNFNFENQFKNWLFGDSSKELLFNRGILNGDFGKSWITNEQVFKIIKKPFKLTLILALISMVISLILAIPFAGILVLFRDKSWVKIMNDFLIFLYAIPIFWLGVLLLVFFANKGIFDWFPSSGIQPIQGYDDNKIFLFKIFSILYYLILPLITLTITPFVFFTRLLQTSLKQQLDSEYILTAKANGYSDTIIIFKHAMRNALFPLASYFFVAFPALLSGSVLVENIFSLPGMGMLLVRSIQNQDFPILIFFFLLIGLFTICSFLLLDIIYSIIDPRSKSKIGGLSNG